MHERNVNKLQVAFRVSQRWNPIDRFLKYIIGELIHVELVFPTNWVPGRNSFSSRGRAPIKGVRFKRINYNSRRNKKRYIFIDIPNKYEVLEKQYDIQNVRENCLSLVRSKPDYDTLGAIFYAGMGIKVDKEEDFWCSEVVAYVLGIVDYKLTPEELYVKIVQMFHNKNFYYRMISNSS